MRIKRKGAGIPACTQSVTSGTIQRTGVRDDIYRVLNRFIGRFVNLFMLYVIQVKLRSLSLILDFCILDSCDISECWSVLTLNGKEQMLSSSDIAAVLLYVSKNDIFGILTDKAHLSECWVTVLRGHRPLSPPSIL